MAPVFITKRGLMLVVGPARVLVRENPRGRSSGFARAESVAGGRGNPSRVPDKIVEFFDGPSRGGYPWRMTGHRKVGVLMGGLSGERDISLRSGEAIVAALIDRGHDACPVFVDRDIDLVLRQMRIDVAFVALHGRYGEDGCIQGL